MADWASISREIEQGISPQAPNGDFDGVRRGKLAALAALTGRPVVLYGTDFTNVLKVNVAAINGASAQIDLTDKDGFYEVTKDLAGPALDVVLYSPGGSAEATESIVALLRARFNDIRFIVPSVAKSAATMLAMSGNSILMDELSELGPIDPQMVFTRNGQTVVAPVQSIRDQFELAQDQIANDPRSLAAWVPILQQYGPALLIQCDNLIQLAEDLVYTWLKAYMFRGSRAADRRARAISKYLADDKNFLSHARRIGIGDLTKQRVRVEDLRRTPAVHDAVRAIHMATMLTFQRTGAVKIFESSAGRSMIVAIQVAGGQPAPPALPTLPAP